MIILIKVENDQPIRMHKIAEELIEDEQWEVIKAILKQLAEAKKK